MPKATFKISGEIDDFSRVDNVHSALKREGAKLLKKWKIEVDVSFAETEKGIVQE